VPLAPAQPLPVQTRKYNLSLWVLMVTEKLFLESKYFAANISFLFKQHCFHFQLQHFAKNLFTQ
jgi:hypothetical protein